MNIEEVTYDKVSLFTREWIEIWAADMGAKASQVSLFTREWIEISIVGLFITFSPSLPLYEGVD